MVQGGSPSQGWNTFFRNHAQAIAAIDLFVVPTLTFERLLAFLVVGTVTHVYMSSVGAVGIGRLRSWRDCCRNMFMRTVGWAERHGAAWAELAGLQNLGSEPRTGQWRRSCP